MTTPPPIDLAALRADMETKAATDPNIDAWVNAGTVLSLIAQCDADLAAATQARAALDFHVAQRKELQSTLSMLADRLDEFSYDELSSLILDEHFDEWGESYCSKLDATTARAEAAEAKIEAVEALLARWEHLHKMLAVMPGASMTPLGDVISDLRGTIAAIDHTPETETP